MTRFITPKFTLFIFIVGLGLLVTGIISFFVLDSILGSIVLTLLGVYMGLSFTGFDIDLEQRKFRYFTSQFGIKEGNWKFFKYYPYLTILTIPQKQTRYSLSGVPSTSKNTIYRICILNQKHTEKIVIKEFENESNAREFAEGIANEFDLTIETYSPDFT